MKKQIFFLALLLGSLSSSAQISLTHFHSFDLGTAISYTRIEGPGVDLSFDGENQVWNAAKLEGGYTWEVSESFIATSATPYETNFPEANVANVLPYSILAFYEDNQNELNLVGSKSEDWNETTYSDSKTILKFPMAFGDSFEDTYSSITVYDDDNYVPFTDVGTIEVTADAYGDLILPYGTIENTIRIKTVDSRIQTTENYGDSELLDVYYTWYDSTYGNRIASYEWVDFGFGPEEYFQYVSEANYTSIIEQGEISNLKVYPNPASEYFQISGADSGSEYKLINQQGQAVLSGFLSEEERIYTTEFSTGIYFLEIKNNKGITRKKIVVQ